MVCSEKLTVVLPLKGRSLHTLRWLWHANVINMPYRILVADGEPDEKIQSFLKDKRNFPNLNYEYLVYDDKTFNDFYFKLKDCLEKVKTEYVMFSDNDDFLSIIGSNKAVEFLEMNSKFVSCGGGVAGFLLANDSNQKCYGLIESFTFRYEEKKYNCRDITTDCPSDRVLDEINNYLCFYYNVYRTEALKKITNEVYKLDFTDLEIHEMYCALRTVTLGKVKSDPTYFGYYRQKETSLRSAYKGDWFEHLLNSDFTNDFNKMVNKIIEELLNKDFSVNFCNSFRSNLINAYALILRKNIMSVAIKYRLPWLSYLKRKIISLSLIQLIPKKFRARITFYLMFQDLKNAGCQSIDLVNYKKELEGIKQTLSGSEFRDFLKSKFSSLLLQRN
jgi:glycosyltransferase domain-containing protein